MNFDKYNPLKLKRLARLIQYIEVTNSILWFLMDGCWMMGIYHPAIVLAVLAVLSALLLTVREFDHDIHENAEKPHTAANLFANLGILLWIVMNALWIIGDVVPQPLLMTYAKISFFSGIVMIALAVRETGVDQAIAKFKRFRFKRR